MDGNRMAKEIDLKLNLFLNQIAGEEYRYNRAFFPFLVRYTTAIVNIF